MSDPEPSSHTDRIKGAQERLKVLETCTSEVRAEICLLRARRDKEIEAALSDGTDRSQRSIARDFLVSEGTVRYIRERMRRNGNRQRNR